MNPRQVFPFAAATVALLAALPARAEPSSNAALAEALFAKGKALMSAQDYEHGCPMLEESQRIDPAGGTLIALALCHERQGRTATAWAEFKEAEALAISEREADREAVSKDHLAKLEPRLSRLSVKVGAEAAIAGLVVRRDGVVLARPGWGLDAPIDPGPHRVEASAPGKKAWSTTITVAEGDKAAAVEVPRLEDEVSSSAPVAKLGPRSTRRTAVAIGLGGAGVTALGVGAVFGVLAITEQAASNRRCPTTTCNDAGALADNASARSHATVADAMLPIGVVASAAGVVLYLTAPRQPAIGSASLRLAVAIRGGPSASLLGAF